ncbi:MAG: carboxypeptidase-like regulatory domain-containing protein [Verrucomicrobia bacterium]|nr:carboxypeptidase-like regulatory domain-containing protein [Verrucomicrobiota bacterium]
MHQRDTYYSSYRHSPVGFLILHVCLCCGSAALAATGSNLGGYGRNFVPAVVTGHLSSENRNPLPGVTVQTSAGHAAISDGSGHYTLYLDGPGTYTLSVQSGRTITQSQEVTGTPAAPTTLNFSFSLALSGQLLGSGLFEVTLLGQPGSNYIIQVSTNLADWSGVVTSPARPGGSILFLDLDSTNLPFRFYRGRTP